MSTRRQETDALASWPTGERLRAVHRLIPRAPGEAVVAQTGPDRAMGRRLPGGFRGWFRLALGRDGRDGYRPLCRWRPPFRPGAVPGRSTLCAARPRLGLAPRRRLAAPVIQGRGPPRTPGAFSRGRRTMAGDGFVRDRSDTPATARAFGRPGSGRAPGAFPPGRLLALGETGSQGRWRSRLKPRRQREANRAPELLRPLQADRLLLGARNGLPYSTVAAVLARGRPRVARLPAPRRVAALPGVPDGSYRSQRYRTSAERGRDRNGRGVRRREYSFADPARPGPGERQRWLTPRLDAELAPATPRLGLYHARWAEARTLEEVKPPQRERPVRRRQPPAGGVQHV